MEFSSNKDLLLSRFTKPILCIALLFFLCSCPYKTNIRLIQEQDGLRVNQYFAGFWKGYFQDGSYLDVFFKQIRKNVWSCHIGYYTQSGDIDSSIFLRVVPFKVNKERLLQVEDPDENFYIIRAEEYDKDKMYFQYLDKDVLAKRYTNQITDRSSFMSFLSTHIDSSDIWSIKQPLLKKGSAYDNLHGKPRGFK